ncbi:alpha-amylase [Halobacillus fulvus]|nr:alpha-amylase [Halobacillus fulvus]
MERNHTMIQFFEWHTSPDDQLWRKLKETAEELKESGIDAVWIPPVTKGQSIFDNGYGVYDLYDLGEFDQKGTVRTKYGTKEELHEAIEACHEHDIRVFVDVVMNHKAGADETERFEVVEVDGDDRLNEISEPFEIEGWTKFTFPGRGEQYSDFKWDFNHFNGTDYDDSEGREGYFKILGENKGWSEPVDDEFGNFDYLMFSNIDYNHPDVRAEMIEWGKWLSDTLGADGYRLDATKHIHQGFLQEFSQEMKKHNKPFYMVGEYWNQDLDACAEFLDNTEYEIDLFDVQLHFNLHRISEGGEEADLSSVFEGTLVEEYPFNAVTFVDNHDSQPGESLESWVQDWFKQNAYALILLRKDGFPCLFYGDYYGIGGEDPIPGQREAIDPLLYVRYHRAYGDQEDYFDHPSTIGWVRYGIDDLEGSGCAVVVTVGEAGSKRMYVGEERAGEEWTDYTNAIEDPVVIDEEGYGDFPVEGGGVSVWALPVE